MDTLYTDTVKNKNCREYFQNPMHMKQDTFHEIIAICFLLLSDKCEAKSTAAIVYHDKKEKDTEIARAFVYKKNTCGNVTVL